MSCSISCAGVACVIGARCRRRCTHTCADGHAVAGEGGSAASTVQASNILHWKMLYLGCAGRRSDQILAQLFPGESKHACQLV